MISCSFCLSKKSQYYIYTVCNHFVCLNCSSLRAENVLKCCNQTTNLSEEVKAQLKRKKQIIKKNLEKCYQYEKMNFNQAKFQQLQRPSARFKNDYQMKFIAQNQQQYFKEKQQNQFEDQQLQPTPINQLYKNNLTLKYKADQFQKATSPIKLVSDLEKENQQSICRYQVQQKDSQNIYKSEINQKIQNMKPKFQSNYKNLIQNTNYSPQIKIQHKRFQKQEFIPILQLKIEQIRKQFKVFYENLEKMQASIIYQTKIYFQEYMKLIEKENQQCPLIFQNLKTQKQRTKNFLNQFINKWNLQKLKKAIFQIQNNKYNKKNTSSIMEISQSNNLKQDQFNFSQILRDVDKKLLLNEQNIQKSSQENSYFPSNKSEISQFKQKQNLKTLKGYAFTCQNLQNISPLQEQNKQASFTARNMDKIYKKLQQSRTKLQQRIQRHNYFMTDRCNFFVRK